MEHQAALHPKLESVAFEEAAGAVAQHVRVRAVPAESAALPAALDAGEAQPIGAAAEDHGVQPVGARGGNPW